MTQPTLKAHSKRTEPRPDSAWMFDTMQSASSHTGTPISLLKASKAAGCRAFKLGNRLDYLEFLRWYFKKDVVETGLPDGFASWREVLESEKAKRETIKRQQDEKSVMTTADACRQAAEAMALTFAELERRDRELPPAMAGLPAVEIFKRMNADTESMRKTLKDKFQAVGQ